MKNLLIYFLLLNPIDISQFEKVDILSIQNLISNNSLKAETPDSITIMSSENEKKSEQKDSPRIKNIQPIKNNAFNFQKEDQVIAFFSIVVSFILSLLLQRKLIARFIHPEEQTFYYEYENGFKKKFYSRRGFNEDHEQKIKKADFKKIRTNLERHGLPQIGQILINQNKFH